MTVGRHCSAPTHLCRQLRRHDVVADQRRRQTDQETLDLKGRVDTLTHEIGRLRETIRVLDKRNRALVLENQSLQSSRDSATAQSQQCDAAVAHAHAQLLDVSSQLDQQRKQFDTEMELLRADASSRQRTHQLDLQHKDNELKRLRESLMDADTRSSSSEAEVLRLRSEMLTLEGVRSHVSARAVCALPVFCVSLSRRTFIFGHHGLFSP